MDMDQEITNIFTVDTLIIITHLILDLKGINTWLTLISKSVPRDKMRKLVDETKRRFAKEQGEHVMHLDDDTIKYVKRGIQDDVEIPCISLVFDIENPMNKDWFDRKICIFYYLELPNGVKHGKATLICDSGNNSIITVHKFHYIDDVIQGKAIKKISFYKNGKRKIVINTAIYENGQIISITK